MSIYNSIYDSPSKTFICDSTYDYNSTYIYASINLATILSVTL